MNGTVNWKVWIFLPITICLASGCIRDYEVVEDPTVIVQLAEDVRGVPVWIPIDGKLVKVYRTLPKGKLVVDRRHPALKGD
jgi:hypothetical protein